MLFKDLHGVIAEPGVEGVQFARRGVIGAQFVAAVVSGFVGGENGERGDPPRQSEPANQFVHRFCGHDDVTMPHPKAPGSQSQKMPPTAGAERISGQNYEPRTEAIFEQAGLEVLQRSGRIRQRKTHPTCRRSDGLLGDGQGRHGSGFVQTGAHDLDQSPGRIGFGQEIDFLLQDTIVSHHFRAVAAGENDS